MFFIKFIPGFENFIFPLRNIVFANQFPTLNKRRRGIWGHRLSRVPVFFLSFVKRPYFFYAAMLSKLS
jgi:hypothetical protein